MEDNEFDYSKKISCCQNSAKRFIRKQTLLSVPEDQRTNDISTLENDSRFDFLQDL